jgi:precorrin-2 dehydrogenase/sirohydrochlorin ferrochelatase
VPTLPIELDLQGRDALVVGAFPELTAKVERLLEAGAVVTVIAEGPPGPELAALAGRITLLERAATDADLEGKAVVFAAPFTTPEGEARARRWHARALGRGALFCCVDRPETCTFVSPAVVRVPGLGMTISTGGRSPGLARRIREDLSALFGDPRFGRFVERLGELRAALPRGRRAAPMARAVEGFAVEAGLRFPAWFERGEPPPGHPPGEPPGEP